MGWDDTGDAFASEALRGSGAGEPAWTGDALMGRGAGGAAWTGDAAACFTGDGALGGATRKGLCETRSMSCLDAKGLGERFCGDTLVGDDEVGGARPSAGDMGVRGLGGAVVWPRINARRVSVKGSVILSKSIVS